MFEITLLDSSIVRACCWVLGFCFLYHVLRQRRADQAVKLAVKKTNGTPIDFRPDNIVTILQRAASSSGSLSIHPPGVLHDFTVISYQELYASASVNAQLLRALPGWQSGCACLILLEQHYDNILWFWSVVLAGGIPVICPPYPRAELKSSIRHLDRILSSPYCFTTRVRIHADFDETWPLRTHAIEELTSKTSLNEHGTPATEITPNLSSIAAIMLTSGSSGNSKAVQLTHGQIFDCMNAKSYVYPCESDATILNWVGMDHVAGLVEAHIRGLWIGVNQVHVHAHDVTSAPTTFLHLLALHQASASFAPNFLLARIVDDRDAGRLSLPQGLDLRHLKILVSGGEACSTDVCRRFSLLVQQFGARENVTVPGFGMTETGAGCIFNRSCPTSDLEENYEFTAVGRCAPGVEMRISSLDSDNSNVPAESAQSTKPGHLEIRGSIVFNGYLNNDEANKESFTADGWFRTGDLGFIDRHGQLVLTGRSKDVICINGVKHLPVDQERIIEDARIPGVNPGYIVCFAWKPRGANTEQCCVIYQHSFDINDGVARLATQNSIARAVLMSTGARPHVLPLPPGILQKSTLGKLSRAKIRSAFENGAFAEYDALNATLISSANITTIVRPNDDIERVLLDIVATKLQLDTVLFGVETDYFEAGMTSVDLFRIRNQICRQFGLSSFSIEILIKHNTVRSLKQAILGLANNKISDYEPVVQLKSNGSRTPLWLIHPGVGEVLVFVGLVHHIQDRPVYALRARGFEQGHDVFSSIDEVITTYTNAMKAHQAHGPYAIAGYSYGSMLAFEITKRLEANGDTVSFLGCFNLPPHIKSRMRQLNLKNCLIHLAMFLRLLNDKQCAALQLDATNQAFETVMDVVLARSDQDRLHELDLSRKALSQWAYVAFALQKMATEYEPTGNICNIDVFYCDPLAAVAESKKEWLDEQLSKWSDFCRTPVRFHAVDGAHYTMLSAPHVRSFHKILAKALSDRNI